MKDPWIAHRVGGAFVGRVLSGGEVGDGFDDDVECGIIVDFGEHITIRFEALDEVADAGIRVLGEPKPGIHGGRISFLHPKDTQGTMVELCDKKEPEDS